MIFALRWSGGVKNNIRMKGNWMENFSTERNKFPLTKFNSTAMIIDLISSEKNMYIHICIYLFKLGSVAEICQHTNQGNG